MESTDVFTGLQDFLQRMRQPSASDFVKSIKTFIVSLSNNDRDPDKDSAAIQEFFASMEVAFRAHPLWSGCSEEELESAGEGLEKYIMTKLFTRLFASLPDDVKIDDQLSEKMALIQQFIRPENLDIKTTFQNEASWLLAQKELQKINMYKAPRDKLLCILNCCRVINNLLLNASLASNENPPGADEFLPVLIYVTIKANPPQLHSNLLYIQRYRCQSRLVSEAAYYFTNMLSAESFIQNIDANALSMDEDDFEKNMESARALLFGLSTELDNSSSQSDRNVENRLEAEPVETKIEASNSNRNPATHSKSPEPKLAEKEMSYVKDDLVKKIPSLLELENKGATTLLKEDNLNQAFKDYPYLFAQAGDLTVDDVEDLLADYKQLVLKYVCLSKELGAPTSSIAPSNSKLENYRHAKNVEEPKDPREQSIDSGIDGTVDDTESMGTLIKEENLNSLLQDDMRNQVALAEEENLSQNDARNKVAPEQENHVALTKEKKFESELPQDKETDRVPIEEDKLSEKDEKDKVGLMEENSESKLSQDDSRDMGAHSDEGNSS